MTVLHVAYCNVVLSWGGNEITVAGSICNHCHVKQSTVIAFATTYPLPLSKLDHATALCITKLISMCYEITHD